MIESVGFNKESSQKNVNYHHGKNYEYLKMIVNKKSQFFFPYLLHLAKKLALGSFYNVKHHETRRNLCKKYTLLS